MSITPDDREALRARFVEYRRVGGRQLRNELIEAHQGLAARIARRFSNRGEATDDLLQVAYLGLLKAVERFDVERNYEFSTFATVTIEGELKRHFRDRAWSIRPPRRQQELHLRLGGAVNELSQELKRSPTVPEVALRLGVSDEEVLEAMEAGGAYRPSSLDAPAAGSDTGELEQRVGREDVGFEWTEQRVLLEEPARTVARTRANDHPASLLRRALAGGDRGTDRHQPDARVAAADAHADADA